MTAETDHLDRPTRDENRLVEPTLLRPYAVAYDPAARARRIDRSHDGDETPILERLERMAVTASRVTDERSIPGEVLIDVDRDVWRRATAPGYLQLFIADHGNDGTVAVVVTRFVVDHGADVSRLIDHAFVEPRALPGWTENEATRTQPGFRTEGSSMQTGTYVGDDQTWYCAIRYAAYRRGNVAYLLHATGTAPAREGDMFRRSIASAVSSVRFED
ncbi:LpqN/LpqT family lipoprotein [Gordonia hankookensis]|nr:LpqN/LpqT family lipoprotein [Gordonia hankookensis]